MSDAETLRAYTEGADAYRARFDAAPSADLIAFEAALPRGARVLDLGCGPGRAAAYIGAQGHAVDAWDATPAFVDAIDAPGVTPRLATFDELDTEALYDGIWASFSLLHAPRSAFPGHLSAVARALKSGGRLHLGMKTGTGEARDRLGRFYAFHTPDELRGHCAAAGLRIDTERQGEEVGLAGTIDPFVVLTAHRHG
ncbi:MAG: class I SAM-dependent DNA methyltransferase [Shimia sp.]